MSDSSATRRQFLSTAAAAGAATLALTRPRAQAAPADKPERVDGIPYRKFGRANERVSLLGVGGYHIGRGDEADSIRMIQEAVDHGATFMDNAWEYHKGESERRMGKALAGPRRDKAFLMTKHHGRDAKTAMKHLEDNLRRLATDRIDLWQFHEVVHDGDPDMIFARGGGIEAADKAKQQGKVRYVGFTGHKHPWLLLKMLAYDYPWDAVQMPLNPFDGTFQSFQKRVLPVLVKRGIAPLAMKTRASGILVRTKAVTLEECWRYVTALPVATVISGMDSLTHVRENLELARKLEPMTKDEMAALEKRTVTLAATGEHEPYKTTNRFDGPIGRQQHGVS